MTLLCTYTLAVYATLCTATLILAPILIAAATRFTKHTKTKKQEIIFLFCFIADCLLSDLHLIRLERVYIRFWLILFRFFVYRFFRVYQFCDFFYVGTGSAHIV